MKTIIPQILAIYLPQFHIIPENDAWWGKGFTEWTNVKKAVPLFEGHLQPRIPMGHNYYDLANESVLPKQMKLAADYGIDGFCFYHYWFKDGKKLLEKPIEALLKSKSLPLNFMFCWANEPWTRTWDGSFGSKEILMDQEYGGEEEWKYHFYYLLDYFRREEYIKNDGKPVIAIYKECDIPERKKMLSLWDRLARDVGFNGIYVMLTHRKPSYIERRIYGDAIYDFEPFATFYRLTREEHNICQRECLVDGKSFRVYDYAKFCNFMINRLSFSGVDHNLGIFSGWDNSPRIGSRSEIVFENNYPEIFEYYFRFQMQRSIDYQNSFLFINAWNEWGEGAFIEPDEEYGISYLQAIKNVKKCLYEQYG